MEVAKNPFHTLVGVIRNTPPRIGVFVFTYVNKALHRFYFAQGQGQGGKQSESEKKQESDKGKREGDKGAQRVKDLKKIKKGK